MIKKKRAILTISSNNYLHYTRTLMQSAKRHHPDVDLFCAIADRDRSPALELSTEFQAIFIDQLNLPDGDDFLFRYDILELNTAIKPWAIRYLLQAGYESVVYLDPDILVVDALTDAFELLDATNDIVLTPHLIAPVTDQFEPTELTIRRYGTYNLGFCGVSSREMGIHFLEWWSSKLRCMCVNDQRIGVFVDQSWIDLVPGLFSRVAILRHTGYNVAYWNLAQRNIQTINGRLFVADMPLIFFHFSGLVPSNPRIVSKYQNRFTTNDLNQDTTVLFNSYRTQLEKNGRARYQKLPYAFGFYDDGRKIASSHRAAFRASQSFKRLSSPFASRRLWSVKARFASWLTDIYGFLLGRRDPTD